MSAAAEVVARADALLESIDPATAHPDLAQLLASYRSRKDAGDPALWIHGRALVRCADRVGAEPAAPAGPYDGQSVKDLKSEIATRNEGRDDVDLIAPTGAKKADLVAALVADDARE